MASTRKSYLLTPSWGLKPSELALGSVIASVKFPERPLSNKDLPADIDTEVHTEESKDCSGRLKDGNKWSIGLFATFVDLITAGGEASYSSGSSSEIEYSCESMETRRFTASPEFIAKAAADSAVKSHLKIGGMGAKVFVVTGVKTAKGVTITITEEAEKDATIHVSAGIPGTKTTVGPKATLNPTRYRTHTKTIDGPIIFAFQVEKVRVNRKSNATSKGYVVGAVLGQDGKKVEYVTEVADEDLDDEDMDDAGLESRDAFEDGEKCRIIVPAGYK
ncbi:hypothetical protein IMZ48_46495 [Candidatus Bathyarchaeota archaeon]|nr:hypothetical protein [Candidatus Bathyarchaeota archaeon]